MKKFLVILLVLSSALVAQAQRRDRDDRYGRVSCTIETAQRGSVTGFGSNCYEAMQNAENRCLNVVRSSDGRRRCRNAGSQPTRFYVECERRGYYGACRAEYPYSN
jgi:hypothetical protein